MTTTFDRYSNERLDFLVEINPAGQGWYSITMKDNSVDTGKLLSNTMIKVKAKALVQFDDIRSALARGGLYELSHWSDQDGHTPAHFEQKITAIFKLRDEFNTLFNYKSMETADMARDPYRQSFDQLIELLDLSAAEEKSFRVAYDLAPKEVGLLSKALLPEFESMNREHRNVFLRTFNSTLDTKPVLLLRNVDGLDYLITYFKTKGED